MDRRTFLGTTAAVVLAGCSEAVEEATDGDGQATYDVGKETLLPDEPQPNWPDGNLTADHDFNDAYDRVWRNRNMSLIVMMSVTVYETVDAAQQEMQRVSAVPEEISEYPIADAGYIATTNQGKLASCFFRDANAAGEVVVTVGGGPGRTRATQYGDALYAYWQDQV